MHSRVSSGFKGIFLALLALGLISLLPAIADIQQMQPISDSDPSGFTDEELQAEGKSIPEPAVPERFHGIVAFFS